MALLRAPISRHTTFSILSRDVMRAFVAHNRDSTPTLYSRYHKSSQPPEGSTEVKSSGSYEKPANRDEAEHDSTATKAEVFDDGDTGYMMRRLSQLAAEATPLRDDPTAGRNPEEEVISEEELRGLQERLAQREYSENNIEAIAAVKLPSAASKHTKDIAYSKPWTGTETTEDAVLRMLVDVNKPLRIPGGRGGGGGRGIVANANSTIVSLPKLKRSVPNSVRLVQARESSLEYSIAKNTGTLPDALTKTKMADATNHEEDPEFSRLYRERFRTPRAMPGTLQGLRALADERIEDARARGQFNNIKRGGKLDMDARISSPFLDTTEFFLNRIIQRQDIAPPWIDKQQTITQDLRRFRMELRDSWKRHAMRLVTTEVVGLDGQMQLARQYAEAEKVEAQRSGILKSKAKDTVSLAEAVAYDIAIERGEMEEHVNEDATQELGEIEEQTQQTTVYARIPKQDWENMEQKYHEAAIKSLNDNIRSYNLMAPAPARRSYLSLDRERALVYAEVAPNLAEALRERDFLIKSGRTTFTTTPSQKPGTIVNRLFGEEVVIMEKRGNEYGLKEMFRDLLFKKKSSV